MKLSKHNIKKINKKRERLENIVNQKDLLDNRAYVFETENNQLVSNPSTSYTRQPDLTGQPCNYKPYGPTQPGQSLPYALPSSFVYLYQFSTYSEQTGPDGTPVVSVIPDDVPPSETIQIPDCWPLHDNDSECFTRASMNWFCLPDRPEFQTLDCAHELIMNPNLDLFNLEQSCNSIIGCTWSREEQECQHIGRYGSPSTMISCIGTCCPINGEWDVNCDGVSDASIEQNDIEECSAIDQNGGHYCPDGSFNSYGECGPSYYVDSRGPDGGCTHSSYQGNPKLCDASQCGCKYCHTSDQCLTIEEHNATCEDDICSGTSVEILGYEYDIESTTMIRLDRGQHNDENGPVTDHTFYAPGAPGFSGPFPEGIKCLRNLREIDLSRNYFSGPIPEWIGTLPFLAHLDISQNRAEIDGEVILGFEESFADFLRKIAPLQNNPTGQIGIDIFGNSFYGDIPEFIGEINFTYFNVSANQLTGRVPDEVCNWYVEPFNPSMDYGGSFFDYNDEWVSSAHIIMRNNFLTGFPWCFYLGFESVVFLPQHEPGRNESRITSNGGIEIEIPEIDLSRQTWTYDRPDWFAPVPVTQPAAFLYLVGKIEVDGVNVDRKTCAAPQEYTDVHMWSEYITIGPGLPSGNEQCDDLCQQSCMEEHPNLQYLNKYSNSTQMCECYCSTRPLDCDDTYNRSGEGGYFPNHALTSPQNPSGRGDAIGVFYDGLLIGWDFINNLHFAASQGSPNYQEVYNRKTLPGISIPMAFRGPTEIPDKYPEQGTILNSSNTEIILYKADTQTFHGLVGNSPQDVFNTEILLAPSEITTIGLSGLSWQDFEYTYDEFGNTISIIDYGPNMLTYTFGPPIQPPQELPPIEEPPFDEVPGNYCQTDEDCTGRLFCFKNTCVVERPTGECYCECMGYNYAITHGYLDEDCFGELDCAQSCEIQCESEESTLNYSQCIISPENLLQGYKNGDTSTTPTPTTRNYVVNDTLFYSQWYLTEWDYNGHEAWNWPGDGCYRCVGFGGGCGTPCTGGQFVNAMHLGWSQAIETYGFGQNEPVIAVIDDGFDLRHQDLVNKLWTCPPDGNDGNCEPGSHGYSFSNESTEIDQFYMDDYPSFHGTAVASLVAADTNSGSGIAGMCPNCRLMILHSDSSTTGHATTGGRVEQAIYYAVANGARVISLSDTWSIAEGTDDGVREAIQYARDNNVLFVSSAGNEVKRLSEPNQYGNYRHPASWPEGLTVGAANRPNGNVFTSTTNITVTEGNTFGVDVQISAPGSMVLSATSILPCTIEQLGTSECVYWNSSARVKLLYNDQGIMIFDTSTNQIDYSRITDSLYYNFSGTSCSTPLVSGLAGLLLSHNMNLTVDDLLTIIISTADDQSFDGKQSELEELGGYDTEINWESYLSGLPFYPYSTSVSREEIPPVINVLNALNMLYEGLPGEPNEGEPDVTDIVELTDLILNYDYDESLTLPASVRPEFDLNGDGNIDIYDLVMLIRIVVDNPRTPTSSKKQIEYSLKQIRRKSPKKLSTEEIQLLQSNLTRIRKK